MRSETMTRPNHERRRHRAHRLTAILLLATCLAGCDKCGDYFWIDNATPHSCKQTAPSH